jgi:hypothetical protein
MKTGPDAIFVQNVVHPLRPQLHTLFAASVASRTNPLKNTAAVVAIQLT